MKRPLMRRPHWDGCPAPAHTDTGTIQCVVQKNRCTEPGHAKWRRLGWVMPLVWAVKPWWPNATGRAMDAGRMPLDPATCQHNTARALPDEGRGLYRCMGCGTKLRRIPGGAPWEVLA